MLNTQQTDRTALHAATALLVELAVARNETRPMPGWQATPRQQQAMESVADEILYGGAAGGGKSEMALVLSRTAHKSSLLLRRTFASLDRNLIPRAKLLFRPLRSYNHSAHRWQFDDGTRITFGHMQNTDDFDQYRSDEYDLIWFDELTEFDRVQYEFMLSRLRTSAAGQRVRMGASSNPGGIGTEWVVERWAPWLDPAHPRPALAGELRWFARAGGKETEVPGPAVVMMDGEEVRPMSRTFIPAKASDNPHLSPDYRARLQALPEPFRSQMKDGNWQIGMQDDAQAAIPRNWIRQAMARWKPLTKSLPLTTVGVDPARGGDDRTVLAVRRGHHVERMQETPGARTPTGKSVVALFASLLKEGGTAAIDAIGIGSAVIDAARDAALPVDAVNFGAGTDERDGSGAFLFANIRALAYWRLREALDPDRKLEGDDLPVELPDDPELFAELAAPRWMMTGNGRIKIEPKDEIKSRLGRSPDKADAVALAFHGRKPFDALEYVRLLKAAERKNQ